MVLGIACDTLATSSTSSTMATTTLAWNPQTSDLYSSPTPTLEAAADSASQQSQPSSSFWDTNKNYISFFIVFVVAVIIAAFVINRRKKQTAQRNSVARSIALSRDLENANLNRGWGWGALSRDYSSGPIARAPPASSGRAQGGVRGAMNGAMNLAPWRRRQEEEEGLNEAGEAPPPYKPGPDNDTVLETGQSAPQSNATPLAVPPPTLARNHSAQKPPDYSAAITSPVSADTGPSNSVSAHAISAAAANTNDHVDSGNAPPYSNDSHERR